MVCSEHHLHFSTANRVDAKPQQEDMLLMLGDNKKNQRMLTPAIKKKLKPMLMLPDNSGVRNINSKLIRGSSCIFNLALFVAHNWNVQNVSEPPVDSQKVEEQRKTSLQGGA